MRLCVYCKWLGKCACAIFCVFPDSVKTAVKRLGGGELVFNRCVCLTDVTVVASMEKCCSDVVLRSCFPPLTSNAPCWSSSTNFLQ